MSRIRVLVVDSDPAVRAAIARLLEIEGFVVATAGARGERNTTFRPDVVLSDIAKPVDYQCLLKQVLKRAH